MAAYRRVYDSRHLQADCQGPGSAPELYARSSSMDYLFTTLHPFNGLFSRSTWVCRYQKDKTGLDLNEATDGGDVRPSQSTWAVSPSKIGC